MARKAKGKMFLYVLGAVALVAILVIVMFSRTLPTKVEVERTVVMSVDAEVVFPWVNNLKNWEEWSPWREADSEMVVGYRGPEAGAGAISEWESKKTPSGAQVIVTSVPDRQVELVQDFGEDGVAEVEFSFQASGEGATEVTWKMEMNMGLQPFGRFLVPAMQSEVELAYARGLHNLKQLVEGSTPPLSAPALGAAED